MLCNTSRSLVNHREHLGGVPRSEGIWKGFLEKVILALSFEGQAKLATWGRGFQTATKCMKKQTGVRWLVEYGQNEGASEGD